MIDKTLDKPSAEMIAEIASKEMREKFPLLDKHYSDQDVIFILKAYIKWYYLNRIAREVK